MLVVPTQDLRSIFQKCFSMFESSEVVPVVPVSDVHIAELFHGPTMAFKDLALQVVGGLLDYFLQRRKQRMTVVVATSGDTGSAAIQGCRSKDSMDIFVLFPMGRISATQERQMTTVADSNVHVIGMERSSDDLDVVVRALFNDLDFKKKYNLTSINSVNIGRILMQLVHYFFTFFKITSFDEGTGQWKKILCSVPTGAFGNGVAGTLAILMGLPLEKLIIATNSNDILYRFFTNGIFSRGEVVQTVSPAIDIQVPYNFERYLYFLTNMDSKKVTRVMSEFEEKGTVQVEDEIFSQSRKWVASASVSTDETVDLMRNVFHGEGYLMDPHTAVGVAASKQIKKNFPDMSDLPCVCLATASPGKFSETVRLALGDDAAFELPHRLAILKDMPTRFEKFSEDLKKAEMELRQAIASSWNAHSQ
eukprot:TRINITY_DN4842_c0_g1_i5.p1 TRINITY_DN4842_c0_g1~~TRINITY_DN4842_c0_g1_i5.p1  ORF type:complete len:420 (+),score=129.68 TRINITY_DN4842_c0_g1_i5:245-1504(+)